MIDIYVGFTILSVLTMKKNVFWDVSPWSMVEVHTRFGGTYYLHAY
jgi:hypothetical protein